MLGNHEVTLVRLQDRIWRMEQVLDKQAQAIEDRAKILEKYSDWDIPTPRESLIKSYLKKDCK